jgi:hypothetical protein
MVKQPYIPAIIKQVVDRVNTYFQSQPIPFEVTFDNGLYNQVGNDRLKDTPGLVLIWLVMPFIEPQESLDYYSNVSIKIIIAKSTDTNHTQIQREAINYFPHLFPVYEKFLEELSNQQELQGSLRFKHNKEVLPYWGGGDVAGPSQTNLWQDYVDAIKISELKLQVDYTKNCIFTHN